MFLRITFSESRYLKVRQESPLLRKEMLDTAPWEISPQDTNLFTSSTCGSPDVSTLA